MAVTKFVLAVLIALTSWDVVTTYYGAVSVFVGFNTDVGANLGAATPAQHITAILIAITLITIVLCYKIIVEKQERDYDFNSVCRVHHRLPDLAIWHGLCHHFDCR